MGFFARRRAALVQDVISAVMQAVETRLEADRKPRLGEAGDFYTSAIGSMASFLEKAGDLAVRGAAAQLGQRGGKARQAKARALREAATASSKSKCRLCENPMARNLSISEILEHNQRHDNRGNSDDRATEAQPGSGIEPTQSTNGIH